MAAPPQVEEGDRYVTDAPCCADCRRGGDGPFLAVEPYRFEFRAPAKGRWLGRPLLALFVAEFAFIPSAPARAAASTLDPRASAVGYAREMGDGALWVEGREGECRAAGRAARDALAAALGLAPHPDDAAAAADGWWEELGAAVAARWSAEEVRRWLAEALPEPRVCLRQRDVVRHAVRRREGRLFAGEPLRLMRCRLPGAPGPGAPLVVGKPSGLPVHPSGAYRKNSVTSILEDVFGGCDRGRYAWREERAGGGGGAGELVAASVYHRAGGFELIRVHLGPDAVPVEAWERLKACLGGEAEGEAPPPPPLKVFVVHRLDAATSGVLLFALDTEGARATAALLADKSDGAGGLAEREEEDGGSSKVYLARVLGEFDPEALAGAAAAAADECGGAAEDVALEREPGEGALLLRVRRPVGCLSHHDSLYWAAAGRRAARFAAAQRADGPSQATAAALAAAPPSEGDRAGVQPVPPKKDATAVEAKRLRMQAATLGKRRREESGGEASTDTPGGDGPATVEATVAAGCAAFDKTLKSASSSFRVVSRGALPSGAKTTTLECRLGTGRTHQLRVHLAGLGHPVVGDERYARLAAALPALLRDGRGAAAEDAVEAFYRGRAEGVGAVAGATERKSGGCVCPDRIDLHAWRYSLRYGSESDQVSVPPPPWYSAASAAASADEVAS